MPYVRRRGSHLAIVHGSRNPVTKKVEQEVLMTLHSKAEALAAIGRSSEAQAHAFRDWMEDRYPEIRFSWPKIDEAIDELKDELPDIAKSREDRALGGFDGALTVFARHLMAADPQDLDSARELLEKNRSVLEWLLGLLEWRLEMAARAQPSEWTRDPFGWRLALGGGTLDPELEEGIAERIRDGRENEAEDIFEFLVRVYPQYAEGWNYLGIIALERGDLELALERFETCERIGRKLFPKRIPKREYWSRLETRPYIRGLTNQGTTLLRLGRFGRALRIAERLGHECGDEIGAAALRAVIHLGLRDWQLAYEAASHIALLHPEHSLLAAFAAFELGARDEARARFRHAMSSRPRAVGRLLGQRLPAPQSWMEAQDLEAGASLSDDLRGFLDRRSAASKRFFAALWRDEELSALREQVLELERILDEAQGRDRDEAAYRRSFDRLRALREPPAFPGLDGPT